MASENDAGRDKKLTLTLVASAVVALVGGTYFVWSWLATPPPAPPRLISIVSARRCTTRGQKHRRIGICFDSITRKGSRPHSSEIAALLLLYRWSRNP